MHIALQINMKMLHMSRQYERARECCVKTL
jgi:hypothetical protein